MLHKKLKKRSFLIDSVRVSAILLMIITHVIALTFNHDEGSSIVFAFGMFSGTAAFIMFLFLSGASKYFSLFHIAGSQRKKIHLKKIETIKRTLSILGGYYVLALASLFVFDLGFNLFSVTAIISDIVRVMLLLRVPPFTEFLLTFMFLTISTLIFRRVYVYILKRKWLLVSVVVGSFILGSMLYSIDLGNPILNLYKALFVGHENVHTFPVVQYFSIYLLGAYFGEILFENSQKRNPLRVPRIFIGRLLGITSVGAIASAIIFYYTQNRIFDTSVYDARFPPSAGFLLLGLAITLGFSYLYSFLEVKKKSLLFRGMYFISRHTFLYFIIHTIILFGFSYGLNAMLNSDSWKYTSVLEISIVSLFVIFLSTLLISVQHYCIVTYKRLDPEKTVPKFILSILGIIAIFVGVALSFNSSGIQSFNESSFDSGRVLAINENPENWFDHGFKHYQEIFIGSLNQDQLFIAENLLSIELNHQAVLSENPLLPKDGSDIDVVGLYPDGSFDRVASFIENPNTNNTKIYFNFDGANQYFVYYGHYSNNPKRLEAPGNVSSAIELALSDQISHIFSTNLDKKWYLTDYEDASAPRFSVNIPNGISEQISVEYEIIGSDISGTIAPDTSGNYSIELPVENLDVGEYFVQATIYELSDSATTYKTYRQALWVSYPVYVSWTMDWEGFGVSQVDLNDITDISNSYQMPITHFFNPRIYLENQYSNTVVSPEEADYYTNWVLQRRSIGDQIGLHLHFYPDVLEAAGVEFRDDARLIGINRDESYIQAYSYDELVQIFEWSLQVFEEEGLTDIISFRSGAWMSSPDVLKALADVGIKVDSSGRTSGLLNPAVSSSTPIPWNLEPTTMPYKPNFFNINLGSSPTINIWEIPNNGADSFWFSLEELISRFDQNYGGFREISTEPKIIVYLSHPHGFTSYDTSKIRGIFNYTNNFLYTNDRGPVVYETIETYYEQQLRE